MQQHWQLCQELEPAWASRRRGPLRLCKRSGSMECTSLPCCCQDWDNSSSLSADPRNHLLASRINQHKLWRGACSIAQARKQPAVTWTVLLELSCCVTRYELVTWWGLPCLFCVVDVHLLMAESSCNIWLQSTAKCMCCVTLRKQEVMLSGVTSWSWIAAVLARHLWYLDLSWVKFSAWMLSHLSGEWILVKETKVTSALLSLVWPWSCRLIYL